MFLETLEIEPENEIEFIRMMTEKVEIAKDSNNQYDVKIKFRFEL